MNFTYRDIIVAKKIGGDAISEASLGRIYQHIRGQGLGMITAHIDAIRQAELGLNLSDSERSYLNHEHQQQLAQGVRDLGYGIFVVSGIQQGAGPGGEDIVEPTLVIPGAKKEHLRKLAKKYNQRSFLFVAPGTDQHVFDINTETGQEVDIGTFHPMRIGKYYSKVKGHPFVFEGFASGYMEGMSLSREPVTDQEIFDLDLKLKTMKW